MFSSIILYFTILQISTNLPVIAQFANYILLMINGVYTVVMTVFIVPTWREHKTLVKDYNERVSNSSSELKNIEKARLVAMEHKVNKVEKDISEINHSIKNLTNQLSTALKRKEDEPDWEEFIKLVNKLNAKL